MTHLIYPTESRDDYDDLFSFMNLVRRQTASCSSMRTRGLPGIEGNQSTISEGLCSDCQSLCKGQLNAAEQCSCQMPVHATILTIKRRKMSDKQFDKVVYLKYRSAHTSSGWTLHSVASTWTAELYWWQKRCSLVNDSNCLKTVLLNRMNESLFGNWKFLR